MGLVDGWDVSLSVPFRLEGFVGADAGTGTQGEEPGAGDNERDSGDVE